MDICHLKNLEIEPHYQKYKGRVVLRGDMVKDDSGSHAAFTEQGSSASQMSASRVTDIISRLPGCAGQAADAVSAYAQVKMENAPSLLKIPKSDCPDIWIPLPKHKWPKSWSSLLNEICTVILWQDYRGNGNLRKFYQNTVGKKFRIGNVYALTEKKDCSYPCMWTVSNWQARQKTQNRLGKYE